MVVNDERNDYELFFYPDASYSNSTLNFRILEDGAAYWLDNVELYELDLQIAYTEDSIRFIYNPSKSSVMVSDGEYYIDPKGEIHHNFELPPFSSLVLLHTDNTTLESEPRQILEQDLRIYPNPATSFLRIDTDLGSGERIRIFNISGSLVHEEAVTSEDIIIDVKLFPKGIYLLRIDGDNTYKSSKFVVI